MEIFGFTFSRKDKNKNNPASEVFDNTINNELEEIVNNYAATSIRDKETDTFDGVNPDIHNDSLKDTMCMPINSNKVSRLRQYNLMSRFPEILWCISELGLDFFHEDENKNIINLSIPSTKYIDSKRQEILQSEFNHFIKLFNFDENGYSIINNYIIEGECAWENVIDPNAPEKGIRSLKYIPTKYYDFIKDRKTGEILGIYFDKDQVNYDILTGVLSNSYAGASTVFNAIMTAPVYTYSMSMTDNKIPLFWPQVTYFNTGMYNFENTIVLPLLENASAPYQQLSLLQDAAVILRITRAPERLVFNIGTGSMPDKKAKTLVQEFINKFKSKKVSNGSGQVRNAYDPASMLESYFFWKQQGAEGSSVTALNSQADYSKMDDIDYFLRRILKAFKVPYTRFKEEGIAVQRKETITYEEYSFTKYIIRQQKAFASAIKQSFITHLKLRKIWEEYDLNDTLLNIEFVKPSLYELYQAQQLASLKMTIFKEAVEDESFSKGLAMQKYLGYTEDQVKNNAMKKREEVLFNAETEYFVELIKKNGPKDISTSTIEIKQDGDIADSGNEIAPDAGEEIPGVTDTGEVPPETPTETPIEEPTAENPNSETTPEQTPNDNTPEEITSNEPSIEDITPSEEIISDIVPATTDDGIQEPIRQKIDVTNIETPEEYAGTDLLAKPNEYPETEIKNEIPLETEKVPTFREIFSKRNR